MPGAASDDREIAKWDPTFTKQVANTIGPLIKRYYRAEVRCCCCFCCWSGYSTRIQSALSGKCPIRTNV